MTVALKPIGSFFPLDETGCIVNDCTIDNVPRSLLAPLVEQYRRWFGDELISIYIRGSVARGNAVDGVSDLDTYAVVAAEAPPQCHLLDADIEAQLKAASPGLTGFEFHACSAADVNNYFSTWAFLVKTQSVCVYGKDFAAELHPYRPGPEIMGEAMYLPQRMALYRERLRQETKEADILFTCEWMMKAMVRAAFDLTMDRLRQYTRDMYVCYSAFSEVYPEREEDCRRVLQLALNPTLKTDEHLRLVEDFGGWIIAEMSAIKQRYAIDLEKYRL